MLIAFLIGTRPEVIKISPAIKECQKRGIDFFIISSNQHYDDKLFSNFLLELGFPFIKYAIEKQFELQSCYELVCKILRKERPDYIWVGGDTDTAFVGALAGWDTCTSIIHRESGVRSFDRRMHEEKNRIMIDKLATIKFAPTEIAVQNLKNEEIAASVYLTGNLIVDAVKSRYLFNKNQNPFIYLTLHRRENIESRETLGNMLTQIFIHRKQRNILFPVHPNVEKFLGKYLRSLDFFYILEPIPYYESLYYIQLADYVITDSGGIQEEACILGTPCVVLRKTSDRPETINCGAAILIDPDSRDWKIKFKKKKWKHPYGSNVAKKMFDILEGL